MSINSREKGSGNERDVAKKFSAWAGQEFNRVPASGGLRWKADNNVTGDIVAPAAMNFPFSIECKKVECDWELDKLLGTTSELWKFWEQACEDAVRLFNAGVTSHPKEPLLIFTKNRRKHHIMVRFEVYEGLLSFIKPLAIIESETENKVAILPLSVLLENVTVEAVLKYFQPRVPIIGNDKA